MIGDTILAQATATGSSERGVLRLSGPAALAAAQRVWTGPLLRQRGGHRGALAVRGRELPALALVMLGGGSYTGEDTVELHLPGSPLLLALVQDDLLAQGRDLGVRLATPGEFTRRAYEHGRLDLLQAEGVLALIEADGADDARPALLLLHGEASAALQATRTALQQVLALLEAGLDFTAGETGEVPSSAWLPGLLLARERCAEVLAGLPVAKHGGDVLLLGAANAGKSSLCNALAGRPAVLVGDEAGTTRDVVRVELGDGVWLWDAPGDVQGAGGTERAALALRDRLAGGAAAALWVVDPRAPFLPATSLPVLALVSTRRDLGVPMPADGLVELPHFAVSTLTGAGVEELRAFLHQRCRGGARSGPTPLCLPTTAALAAIDAALAAAAAGVGAELVAVDVQAALAALQPVAGEHTTEHLLDRLFARFCLGK